MARIRDIEDISHKTGSYLISKGKGVEAFDFAPDCTEDCPLYDTCRNESTAACVVHIKYMDYVQQRLGKKFLANLSDKQKVQTSLMLFPLFKQLLRFKLYEMSLPLEDLVSKGQVNGVYKEIRAVIKDINSLLDTIKPGEKVKSKSNGDDDDDLLVSEDFHEKLIQGKVNNVGRRKRK